MVILGDDVVSFGVQNMSVGMLFASTYRILKVVGALRDNTFCCYACLQAAFFNDFGTVF